jgi:FkbM family methyltransferase
MTEGRVNDNHGRPVGGLVVGLPPADRATWRSTIKKFARRFGVDVTQYDPASHGEARMSFLLQRHGIDLVIDAGANVGQFGVKLRWVGYKGRIVSFEPSSTAFARLQAEAAASPPWHAIRSALGARTETATLHVAGNSVSSSLREMLPAHVEAAPGSSYVGEESVPVRRLDDVPEVGPAWGSRLFLKSDTQGHEASVLEGAGAVMDRVRMLQIEGSLVPMYDGEMVWPRLHEHVVSLGFALAWVEAAFSDVRSGRLLQVDALYTRP